MYGSYLLSKASQQNKSPTHGFGVYVFTSSGALRTSAKNICTLLRAVKHGVLHLVGRCSAATQQFLEGSSINFMQRFPQVPPLSVQSEQAILG